jgi:hypothetical protein
MTADPSKATFNVANDRLTSILASVGKDKYSTGSEGLGPWLQDRSPLYLVFRSSVELALGELARLASDAMNDLSRFGARHILRKWMDCASGQGE